ncbi:MAG: ABC transporter substrate-binding protein, partial [Litorilinea sp.]
IDPRTIDDVLLIVESAATGSAIAQAISTRLTQIQVQSEVLTVDLPSQDFSSTVARILARPVLPDMVFILLPGDAALLLQSQLLHAGIGPTRGVDIVSSHSPRYAETFWQTIPNGQDTLIGHFGPRPTLQAGTASALRQAFLSDYEPYMDGWPPAWVFAAYDAAFLFAHAARQAETLDGNHVARQLRRLDVELSAGRYYFPDAAANTNATPQSSSGQPITLAQSQSQSMWQQWPAPPLYYLRYTTPDQPFAAMEVVWPSVSETAHNRTP